MQCYTTSVQSINDFLIVNHDNPSSSNKLYVTKFWERKGKKGFKYKVHTKH